MRPQATWFRACLQLTGNLAVPCATAGAFGLIFYSLETIDAWLRYQTTVDLILESGLRLLVVLAIAFVFSAVGTAVVVLLSAGNLQAFERRGSATANFLATMAIVFCSLVLWREVFRWMAIVGLLTFPTVPKYVAWLICVFVWLALFRHKPQKKDEAAPPFAEKTSRRAVIATGLSAAAVTAMGLRPTRSDIGPLVRSPRSSSPNFIMVTFDALSAEDMSLYGYRLPTTPNLQSLAQTASVFRNFYSCCTWTTPSVISLQTGRYPVSTRVFQAFGRLQGDAVEKCLVRELRAAGYQTAASVANLNVFPPRVGLGFDVTLRPPMRGIFSIPPILLDDALLLQQFVREKLEAALPTESQFPPELSFAQADTLLAALKPPFFLWVHVMAPHFPYAPSPQFKNRFLNDDYILRRADLGNMLDLPGHRYSARQQPIVDKWRLRYNEWIAEADSAFGEFLARLQKNNRLDNTVLLVSADHGESFEGGFWGHGARDQVRQNVHVPLIIQMPGQMQARQSDFVFDQTAIAPTILDLAGLPIPKWMEGMSITSMLQPNDTGEPSSGGVAFTQCLETGSSAFEPIRRGTVGVIADDHQHIVDIETGKGALYRLAEANLQNNDISTENSSRAAFMRKLITSRFPTLPWGTG